MPDQPPEKNNGDGNMWRQIGRYSHLGLILPASVVVGLLIGAGLDRWLKTSWITLAGVVLGCVAGFAEMIRIIIQASKET
jgi:F0F1-type ATP synthase assembly protein I